MHDLSVLKLLLREENYRAFRDYIDKELFTEAVQPLLSVVDAWRTEHDGDLTVDDVQNLLFARFPLERHGNEEVLEQLRQIEEPKTALAAVKALKQARSLKELALKAHQASMGRISADDVVSFAKTLEEEPVEEVIEFVTDDLDELLNNTVKAPGLRWRLMSLNKSLGSLRKGDFGFVFARPETGKTTFLASEITHMAEQLHEDNGPIIWFNNEEQGQKVKLRLYQATTGKTVREILQNPNAVRQEYLERIKDKILLFDRAKIDKKTVEHITRKYNPSLILFDQIDKVQGFKNERYDLQLGEIYIWGRELAKEYCPVIGVSQADGSGEGIKYLTMNNVANAKTAKQAEADFIVGIGKTHDMNFEDVRYFSICKNKLTGDADTEPELKHARFEVRIKPMIARYEDLY